MHIEDIGNPVVQAAVRAMNAADRDGWFALFAADAILTDDGNMANFTGWSNHEVFEDGGHILSIEKIEDGGLRLIAKFHSDRWGDFDTFMNFEVQNGKITRLDVGQVD
jgi:hypothetical protein